MTCAIHLIGIRCREDDGESHSSFTNMHKRVHIGKEEQGSGYVARARTRNCGMQRARSDVGHLLQYVDDERGERTSLPMQKIF